MASPKASQTSEHVPAVSEAVSLREQVLSNGWKQLADILQDPEEYISKHGSKPFRYADEGGLEFTTQSAYARGCDPDGQLFTMIVEEISVANNGGTEARSGVRIVAATGEAETVGFTQPKADSGMSSYLTITRNDSPSSKAQLSGELVSLDIQPEDELYDMGLRRLLSFLGSDVEWMFANRIATDETMREEERAAAEVSEDTTRHTFVARKVGGLSLAHA